MIQLLMGIIKFVFWVLTKYGVMCIIGVQKNNIYMTDG
mgnify:CR=1 FL=1